MTETRPDEVVENKRTMFRTKDLNQAAFMMCQKGAKLEKLEGVTNGGTSVFFIFSLPLKEQETSALIFQYVNGDTLVDPLQFCQSQSKLRDLLHMSINKRGEKKNDSNDRRRADGQRR